MLFKISKATYRQILGLIGTLYEPKVWSTGDFLGRDERSMFRSPLVLESAV